MTQKLSQLKKPHNHMRFEDFWAWSDTLYKILAGTLRAEDVDQVPDEMIGFIFSAGYGVSIPGFIICDGRVAYRDEYPILFEKYGTRFGSGDGITTFGVPDMRSTAMVGVGNMGGVDANRIASHATEPAGAIGGSSARTMTISNMVNHNHMIPVGIQNAVTDAFEALPAGYSFGIVWGFEQFRDVEPNTTAPESPYLMEQKGSGSAFSIMMPYQIADFYVWGGVS